MAVTTAAMMYILPVQDMATSTLVASDAAKVAFGAIGGGIIALLICLSVLGATNATILSAPRSRRNGNRQQLFFTGRQHASKIQTRRQCNHAAPGMDDSFCYQRFLQHTCRHVHFYRLGVSISCSFMASLFCAKKCPLQNDLTKHGAIPGCLYSYYSLTRFTNRDNAV